MAKLTVAVVLLLLVAITLTKAQKAEDAQNGAGAAQGGADQGASAGQGGAQQGAEAGKGGAQQGAEAGQGGADAGQGGAQQGTEAGKGGAQQGADGAQQGAPLVRKRRSLVHHLVARESSDRRTEVTRVVEQRSDCGGYGRNDRRRTDDVFRRTSFDRY